MDAMQATLSSGSTWLVIAAAALIGAGLGRYLRPAAGAGIGVGVAAMILAGLVIAGLLVWGLGNSNLLTQLSNVAASRGVVTYLLIITTACVIVIAAIGNFWSSVEIQHRASKDLVALLLTLVGPILGFYFGSSSPPPPPPPDNRPAAASAPATPALPAAAPVAAEAAPAAPPQSSPAAAPSRDVGSPVKVTAPPAALRK